MSKKEVRFPDTDFSTSAEASIAVKWYQLELKILRRKAGFAAPVTARALGYSGLVMYESLVQGMPGYTSLSEQLGFPPMPVLEKDRRVEWIVCMNAAMVASLKFFTNPNAGEIARIDSLAHALKGDPKRLLQDSMMAYSQQVGQQIAKHIYDWSLTDGGADAWFQNFSGENTGSEKDLNSAATGSWVPTQYEGALLPGWGANRPFLPMMRDIPPPPAYSDKPESVLYREAREVFQVSRRLTAEQTDIARFWADGTGTSFTPAGHSINILNQLLERGNYSLFFAAVTYAKLGIALNDAFICCWRTKYHYRFIRPISYIRKHFEQDWIPFLTTPPFPEYTSGHSVQVAAAAEVLRNAFGDQVAFTDHSNDTLGYTPRTFPSFSAMANEAAFSRLYGGIHFRTSIERGLKQGKEIGAQVNALRFKPFGG